MCNDPGESHEGVGRKKNDGRAYAELTGIVLEAALDSPFLYGCFGFLMRQGHILTEANHHAHQGGAFVR